MDIDFDVILTSDSDRDDFFIEVWLHDELIAIVEENGELELFKNNVDQSIFNSPEFISVIEKAIERLSIEY